MHDGVMVVLSTLVNLIQGIVAKDAIYSQVYIKKNIGLSLFQSGVSQSQDATIQQRAGGRSPMDLYRELPRNEADVFFFSDRRGRDE
jgi:hypothetical protein